METFFLYSYVFRIRSPIFIYNVPRAKFFFNVQIQHLDNFLVLPALLVETNETPSRPHSGECREECQIACGVATSSLALEDSIVSLDLGVPRSVYGQTWANALPDQSFGLISHFFLTTDKRKRTDLHELGSRSVPCEPPPRGERNQHQDDHGHPILFRLNFAV